MTNYTPDLIVKAKAAKSAEELFELAKANGMEITKEDARTYFDQLNATGVVSDDELDVVAGGDGLSCPSDGEEDGSSSGANKTTCLHCQGPVSRNFTKCPWCGKTVVFF
jgi:hypothetical protein